MANTIKETYTDYPVNQIATSEGRNIILSGEVYDTPDKAVYISGTFYLEDEQISGKVTVDAYKKESTPTGTFSALQPELRASYPIEIPPGSRAEILGQQTPNGMYDAPESPAATWRQRKSRIVNSPIPQQQPVLRIHQPVKRI